MENLHIPLHSRHTQTTRRTRRVVWQQALALVLLLLVATSIGRLWFERNTLKQATPEGAIAQLHFTPTKNGWKLLEKHLGDVPLISGAPLTIKDIQLFTNGEFSVFVLPQGKHILAVHAKKKSLPVPLFDSLGIVVQSVNDNVHLLSMQPLTIQSKPTQKPWFSFFPRVRPTLGSIHVFGSNPKNGILFASATNITIKMDKDPTDMLSKSLFSKNLTAAAVMNKLSSTSGFVDKPTTIVIGEGVLLEFNDHAALNDVETIFDSIVSSQNLRLEYRPLPDATLSQEIILDDTFSNKEQVVLNGSRLTRAQTKTGILFLAEKDGKAAISDNQNMMSAWLDNKPNKDKAYCSRQQVIVSLRQVSAHDAALSSAYHNLSILQKLNFACVSQGLFSTNIKFFPEYNP